MKFANPIVLVTRPTAQSQAFMVRLTAEAGTFTPLVSPIFAFESLQRVEIPAGSGAIFTSVQGVRSSLPGMGRIAWCVGDATAAAAQEHGFRARSAGGSANDLVAYILSGSDGRPLVHVRGEVSQGDVAARLQASGQRCVAKIAYRKRPLPLSDDALRALNGERFVLLPLFSSETVGILAKAGPFLAPLVVIAISDAVSERAEILSPDNVVTSARPDLAGMVALVAGLIA